MKQKIVVKVQMNSQKCRTKALAIAASSSGGGVEEIKIEGEEKNQVVVIGEGVDSIRLVKSLRRKVGHSHILSVNEVKPTNSEQQEKKPKGSNPKTSSPLQAFHQYGHHPQFIVVDDDPTPSNCCLM